MTSVRTTVWANAAHVMLHYACGWHLRQSFQENMRMLGHTLCPWPVMG